MHACRRESNSSPPLIQEKRSPNGDATSSSLCASLPCKAGLQPSVPGPDFAGAEVPLTQPELPLCRAAGEDHMGEAFYFAPDGLIGGLPHARSAVGRTACHRYENVLLRPPASGENLA